MDDDIFNLTNNKKLILQEKIENEILIIYYSCLKNFCERIQQ